jgi:MFS family permease
VSKFPASTLSDTNNDRANIPIHLALQRTVATNAIFMLCIQIVVCVLIYYLPFYFQIVQELSSEKSGIDNLPFLMTSLFSPILAGLAVSHTGYYLPFMWLGSALATVGSGLIWTLKIDSPSAMYLGYQVLTGIGVGICNQLPYTVIQHTLPADQVIRGTAMLSFRSSFGPVIGIGIAQAVFANTLASRQQGVLNRNNNPFLYKGTAVSGKSNPNEYFPEAQAVYSEALRQALILPIFAGGLAFVASLGIKWGNLKAKA